MSAPPLVFVSYSHQDRAYKDRLVTFLKILGRKGLISHWDDEQIRSSDDWAGRISAAMAKARIAVLLISADFLASDFIQREEIPTLLERRDQGELVILPVIVKPCPWATVGWLRQLQVYPRDSATLSGADEHHERELHYTAICEEIHRLLEGLEVPDEEVSLSPAEAAEKPGKPPGGKRVALEADGFYTRAGVIDLVERSAELAPGEEIVETLLLFKTREQRTWLVTTDRVLLCVLDDEKRRVQGELIRWTQPLHEVRTVRARRWAGKRYTGLVDIGGRQNWLYSIPLHPRPASLKKRLLDMVERARQSGQRTG